MQREVFMRTMHEMKETTNQEIARQQDLFQQFLENLKEQIIEAVRTPLFASTPMPPSSSGMMRTGQNPTSSDYDYPNPEGTCDFWVHTFIAAMLLSQSVK